MRTSTLQIVAFFVLHILLFSLGVRGNVVVGGKLRPHVDRVIVPNTLLKPHVPTNSRIDTFGNGQKPEPAVIDGLLQIRQFVHCPAGYRLCTDGEGGCCPTGAKCCPGFTCCPSGYICCLNGGCCRTSERCHIDSCCPIGAACDVAKGECVDAGYLPCPKDKFCCPVGYTCFRDSFNALAPACLLTGSTSLPPPTHTITQLTTDITITTPSISLTAPSNSSTPTPSTRPTPNTFETSFSYQVTDLRFTWNGAWKTSSLGCTGSSIHTTTIGDSFTLMVTSATKIYLGLDYEDAEYNVFVTGQGTSFQTPLNGVAEVCTYKQVYSGGRLINVNVTVVLVGTLTSSAKRQSSSLEFQVNEVLVMDLTAALSSSALPSTAPAGSLSSSGAMNLKASWLRGFAAVLLAGLHLAL